MDRSRIAPAAAAPADARPLISAIVTARNYARTLPDALDSLRAQDYPNLEILVLDNASTDGTAEALAPYLDDPRVRYLRHERDLGMIPNHNAGLRAARGAYVAFLAADNVMMPGALTRAQAYLAARPQVDLVYSGLYLMSENGRVMRRREHELGAAYAGGRDELPALLGFGCDAQIEAALAPRALYEAHGPFDERYVAADAELLLRWAARGVRFGYDPEPFIAYRVHAGQQSSVANYRATGRQLAEHLAFLETRLDEAEPERLRGFEHAIGRGVDAKAREAEEAGHPVDAATREEAERLRGRLRGVAARNAATPRPTRLGVIVLAGASLYALEHSLRSLTAQSETRWTAYVVQRPGVPLDAFCARIDPLGRVRVVATTEACGESAALNAAATIADANAFAFLRAGNAFAPDHLARLIERLADPACRVLCARTRLTLVDPALRAYATDEAFPAEVTRDRLLVSPAAPLDAIALAREAIDRARYFHLDFAGAAHWELLLRLSERERLEAFDGEVELHSTLGYDDEVPASTETLTAALRLYDRHPVDRPRLVELRRRYLAELERLGAFGATARDDARARVRAYRAYSGADLVAPVVRGERAP